MNPSEGSPTNHVEPDDHSSKFPTALLSQAGVSIWLDDLSRDRLESGAFSTLIETRNVVGITTNPTLVASAVAETAAYNEQLQILAQQGATAVQAVDALIATDTVRAADLLEPTYRGSQGLDGRVSITVDPALAHQAANTFEHASYLWTTVNRPNLMIEIPATPEGIDAIAEAIATGISVNVTLLFNVDIYRLVIRAYLSGLERAQLAGHDIASIFSVASFLVSPVDAEVDARLGEVGTSEAAQLRGTVGVANARLANQIHQTEFSSRRAQRLLTRGAHVQRLLWASTGAPNPERPDTFYVDELIAPGTVITMSPATLDAFADHGVVASDAITGRYEEAIDTFRRLKAVGISYEKVTDKLLAEGVTMLEDSWQQLRSTVAGALHRSR